MWVGRICKRRVHRENSFRLSSFVRTIGTQSHQTHIVKIYLAWAWAGKSIFTKHFKSSFAIVEQAHFTFWSLSMKLKQKYFCFNHSSFYNRITGLNFFSPSLGTCWNILCLHCSIFQRLEFSMSDFYWKLQVYPSAHILLPAASLTSPICVVSTVDLLTTQV